MVITTSRMLSSRLPSASEPGPANRQYFFEILAEAVHEKRTKTPDNFLVTV
jgi:hypothetical protein